MKIKPIVKNFKLPGPAGSWGGAGQAFDEIVEIGGEFETKGIGYVGNVPVSMLQEGFCFADLIADLIKVLPAVGAGGTAIGFYLKYVEPF